MSDSKFSPVEAAYEIIHELEDEEKTLHASALILEDKAKDIREKAEEIEGRIEKLYKIISAL